MRVPLLIFAMLLVPNAWSQPTTNAVTGAELDTFIEQLGAKRYQDRRAAAKALLAFGAPAAPKLGQATQSEDPEVNTTAFELLMQMTNSEKDDAFDAAMTELDRLRENRRFQKDIARLGKNLSNRAASLIVAKGGRFSSSAAYLDENWKGKASDLKYFRFLPDTKRLYLRDSQLDDASAPFIGQLSHLEKLHLQKLGTFTNAGFAQLGALGNLNSLSLEDTGIDSEGFKHVERHPKLIYLYLGGTKIDGKAMARHLAKHEKLTYLSLVRCEGIKDEDVAEIAKLSQLSTLRLDSTAITGDCIKHLAKMEKLGRLYINECKVDPEALVALKGHPKLTRVYASGIEVTDNTLKKLEKELDGIDIRR